MATRNVITNSAEAAQEKEKKQAQKKPQAPSKPRKQQQQSVYTPSNPLAPNRNANSFGLKPVDKYRGPGDANVFSDLYGADQSQYGEYLSFLTTSGNETPASELQAYDGLKLKGLGNIVITGIGAAAKTIGSLEGLAYDIGELGYVGAANVFAGDFLPGVDNYQTELDLSLDNTLSNWFNDGVTKAQEALAPHIIKPRDWSEKSIMEQFTDGRFWAEEGAHGIGFILSMLAPGEILKRIGLGAAAATKLYGGVGTIDEAIAVGKTFLKGQAKTGRYADAARLEARVNSIAGVTVNTFAEAAAEGGNMYDNEYKKLRAQGLSHEEANEKANDKAHQIFLGNFPILFASNMVLEKFFMNGFVNKPKLKNMKNKQIDNWLNQGKELKAPKYISGRDLAVKGVAGITQEGLFEEGLQTSLEQSVTEGDGIMGSLNKWLDNFSGMMYELTGQGKAGQDAKNFGTAVLLGAALSSPFSAVSSVRDTNEQYDLMFGHERKNQSKVHQLLGFRAKEKSEGFLNRWKNNYLSYKRTTEGLTDADGNFNTDAVAKASQDTINKVLKSTFRQFLFKTHGNIDEALNLLGERVKGQEQFEKNIPLLKEMMGIDNYISKLVSTDVLLELEEQEMHEYIHTFDGLDSIDAGYNLAKQHVPILVENWKQNYLASTGTEMTQEQVKDYQDRLEGAIEKHFFDYNEIDSLHNEFTIPLDKYSDIDIEDKQEKATRDADYAEFFNNLFLTKLSTKSAIDRLESRYNELQGQLEAPATEELADDVKHKEIKLRASLLKNQLDILKSDWTKINTVAEVQKDWKSFIEERAKVRATSPKETESTTTEANKKKSTGDSDGKKYLVDFVKKLQAKGYNLKTIDLGNFKRLAFTHLGQSKDVQVGTQEVEIYDDPFMEVAAALNNGANVSYSVETITVEDDTMHDVAAIIKRKGQPAKTVHLSGVLNVTPEQAIQEVREDVEGRTRIGLAKSFNINKKLYRDSLTLEVPDPTQAPTEAREITREVPAQYDEEGNLIAEATTETVVQEAEEAGIRRPQVKVADLFKEEDFQPEEVQEAETPIQTTEDAQGSEDIQEIDDLDGDLDIVEEQETAPVRIANAEEIREKLLYFGSDRNSYVIEENEDGTITVQIKDNNDTVIATINKSFALQDTANKYIDDLINLFNFENEAALLPDITPDAVDTIAKYETITPESRIYAKDKQGNVVELYTDSRIVEKKEKVKTGKKKKTKDGKEYDETETVTRRYIEYYHHIGGRQFKVGDPKAGAALVKYMKKIQLEPISLAEHAEILQERVNERVRTIKGNALQVLEAKIRKAVKALPTYEEQENYVRRLENRLKKRLTEMDKLIIHKVGKIKIRRQRLEEYNKRGRKIDAKRIAKAEREIVKIREEINKIEQDQTELIKLANEHITNAKELLNNLQEKYDSYQSYITTLKALQKYLRENNEITEFIKEMRTALTDILPEVAEEVKTLEDQQRLNELVAEIRDAQLGVAQAIKEEDSEYTRQASKIQELIDFKQSKIGVVDELLQNLNAELADVKAALTQLEEVKAKLTVKAEDELDQDTSEIDADIQQLADNIKSLEAKLKDINAERLTYVNAIAKHQKQKEKVLRKALEADEDYKNLSLATMYLELKAMNSEYQKAFHDAQTEFDYNNNFSGQQSRQELTEDGFIKIHGQLREAKKAIDNPYVTIGQHIKYDENTNDIIDERTGLPIPVDDIIMQTWFKWSADMKHRNVSNYHLEVMSVDKILNSPYLGEWFKEHMGKSFAANATDRTLMTVAKTRDGKYLKMDGHFVMTSLPDIDKSAQRISKRAVAEQIHQRLRNALGKKKEFTFDKMKDFESPYITYYHEGTRYDITPRMVLKGFELPGLTEEENATLAQSSETHQRKRIEDEYEEWFNKLHTAQSERDVKLKIVQANPGHIIKKQRYKNGKEVNPPQRLDKVFPDILIDGKKFNHKRYTIQNGYFSPYSNINIPQSVTVLLDRGPKGDLPAGKEKVIVLEQNNLNDGDIYDVFMLLSDVSQSANLNHTYKLPPYKNKKGEESQRFMVLSNGNRTQKLYNLTAVGSASTKSALKNETVPYALKAILNWGLPSKKLSKDDRSGMSEEDVYNHRIFIDRNKKMLVVKFVSDNFAAKHGLTENKLEIPMAAFKAVKGKSLSQLRKTEEFNILIEFLKTKRKNVDLNLLKNLQKDTSKTFNPKYFHFRSKNNMTEYDINPFTSYEEYLILSGTLGTTVISEEEMKANNLPDFAQVNIAFDKSYKDDITIGVTNYERYVAPKPVKEKKKTPSTKTGNMPHVDYVLGLKANEVKSTLNHTHDIIAAYALKHKIDAKEFYSRIAKRQLSLNDLREAVNTSGLPNKEELLGLLDEAGLQNSIDFNNFVRNLDLKSKGKPIDIHKFKESKTPTKKSHKYTLPDNLDKSKTITTVLNKGVDIVYDIANKALGGTMSREEFNKEFREGRLPFPSVVNALNQTVELESNPNFTLEELTEILSKNKIDSAAKLLDYIDFTSKLNESDFQVDEEVKLQPKSKDVDTTQEFDSTDAVNRMSDQERAVASQLIQGVMSHLVQKKGSTMQGINNDMVNNKFVLTDILPELEPQLKAGIEFLIKNYKTNTLNKLYRTFLDIYNYGKAPAPITETQEPAPSKEVTVNMKPLGSKPPIEATVKALNIPDFNNDFINYLNTTKDALIIIQKTISKALKAAKAKGVKTVPFVKLSKFITANKIETAKDLASILEQIYKPNAKPTNTETEIQPVEDTVVQEETGQETTTPVQDENTSELDELLNELKEDFEAGLMTQDQYEAAKANIEKSFGKSKVTNTYTILETLMARGLVTKKCK